MSILGPFTLSYRTMETQKVSYWLQKRHIRFLISALTHHSKNTEYYDEESHQVKITSNFWSEESFNDIPFNQLNPNVISLSRTNGGNLIPMETDWCSSDDLHFIDTQFYSTYTKNCREQKKTNHFWKELFWFCPLYRWN